MKTRIRSFLAAFVLLLAAMTPSLLMGQSEEAVNLFTPNEVEKGYENIVSDAAFLTLDKVKLRALMLEKPEAFTLELPLDGRLLTIQLTRHEVLAPGFSVQSSDDGHVDYRPGLYYRGQVSGQSSSLAAVSFFDDMVMGVFSFGGTNYVLGHTR
jgi:hypothetical protein